MASEKVFLGPRKVFWDQTKIFLGSNKDILGAEKGFFGTREGFLGSNKGGFWGDQIRICGIKQGFLGSNNDFWDQGRRELPQEVFRIISSHSRISQHIYFGILGYFNPLPTLASPKFTFFFFF